MTHVLHTRAADRLLQPAGVSCPLVAHYIDTVVQAALDSDFGRRAAG